MDGITSRCMTAFQVISQLARLLFSLKATDRASIMSAFVITDAILLQKHPIVIVLLSLLYLDSINNAIVYLLVLILAKQIQSSYHINYDSLYTYTRSTINQLFGHLVIFYMSRFFLELDQTLLFQDYILINCFYFVQKQNYCVELRILFAVYVFTYVLTLISYYVDLSCVLHFTLVLEGIVFKIDFARGRQTFFYSHLLVYYMYKIKALLIDDNEYSCKILVVSVVSHLMFILLTYQNEIQHQLQTILHIGDNDSVYEVMLEKLGEIKSIYTQLLDSRATVVYESMLQLLAELENMQQLTRNRIVQMFINLCKNSIPDCEQVVYLENITFDPASSSQATSYITIYSKNKAAEEPCSVKFYFLYDPTLYNRKIPESVVALVNGQLPLKSTYKYVQLPYNFTSNAVLLYKIDHDVASSICVFVKKPVTPEFVHSLFQCFQLNNRAIQRILNSPRKRAEIKARYLYYNQSLRRAEVIMLRKKVGASEALLAEAVLCSNEIKCVKMPLKAFIAELEIASIEWSGFCCNCIADICVQKIVQCKAILYTISQQTPPVAVNLMISDKIILNFPYISNLDYTSPYMQLISDFYHQQLECGKVVLWYPTTIPGAIPGCNPLLDLFVWTKKQPYVDSGSSKTRITEINKLSELLDFIETQQKHPLSMYTTADKAIYF